MGKNQLKLGSTQNSIRCAIGMGKVVWACRKSKRIR